MNAYSDQAFIEIFHLIFLKALEKKIEKSLYSLKGGCNLRFFLKSIRYSEDIDFDVTTVSVTTLQKNINKLLNSAPLTQILFGKGIEIVNISSPKQSETTQRWKVGIKSVLSQRTIATKIEFSRRKMDLGTAFESVDSDLIHTYKLQPTLCTHYIQTTALIQKINALIHRTQTQARDIFDIHHLLQNDSNLKIIKHPTSDEVKIAIENTLSVNFADFKGQALAYLLPDYEQYYNSEDLWKEIQNKVINFLKKML